MSKAVHLRLRSAVLGHSSITKRTLSKRMPSDASAILRAVRAADFYERSFEIILKNIRYAKPRERFAFTRYTHVLNRLGIGVKSPLD